MTFSEVIQNAARPARSCVEAAALIRQAVRNHVDGERESLTRFDAGVATPWNASEGEFT